MKNIPLFIALSILMTGLLTLTIWKDAPQLFLAGLLATTLMLAGFSYQLNWLNLDDRQLFKQPLFIVATAYPLYLFFLFGSWTWKGYSLDLSSNGYVTFLEISKLPLIILASSVPLGAIINNIHRTIQTEKQIDDTGLKNRNDIYYNHVKFILDQFEKIKGTEISYKYQLLERSEANHAPTLPPKALSPSPNANTYNIKSTISIHQPMELYRKIFKKASSRTDSSFEVSEEFLSELKNAWLSIHDLYVSTRIKDPKTSFADCQEKMIKGYSDIDITYTKICNLLCLTGHHSKYSFAIQDRGGVWQWYSTFCEGRHIYSSVTSLAAVTTMILDRVRDEKVDELFPSNNPIFSIGSGLIDELNMYFDTICIGPYQAPTLRRSLFIPPEESSNDSATSHRI